MQLRLTYQGLLLGANGKNTRAAHKHEIRVALHRQLRHHWEIHPYLSKVALQDAENPSKYHMILPFMEEKYSRFGWRFVPLVTEFFKVRCSIQILLLRPDLPGSIIRSGDIDNRLKTLFDALRLPQSVDELGGADAPSTEELPLYCLLEDDRLIDHVSVETDVLLQPVSTTNPTKNDVRVIITVNLCPYVMTTNNMVFR